MRLVIDANVVLSAALRDGTVRQAFASTDADLFAPAFLRTELKKHHGAIARRAGLRTRDTRTALDRLLEDVTWVSDAELKGSWTPAHDALGDIDEKDVPYLACALTVHADAIWSFDKDFDNQDLVPRVAHPSAFSP